MPLSDPSLARTPLHHRRISVCGYRRADGLFEVEGHLHDVKDIDFNLASGLRKAGDSIHSMRLRITFDGMLTIVDAETATDAMPYVGDCDRIAPHYKKLIGMTMRPGFAEKVRATFGGTAGCTHLTDLIGILATTAFQTLAGQVHQDPERKPFQLDRCHALATDQPAVAKHYPVWYRGPLPSSERDTHDGSH